MTAGRDQPIVAIATAAGRGAVGIVRISGHALQPLVLALCGRSLPARQASLLPLRAADGSVLDQGLALFFPAPHSYTGEDVLELQVHGGPVLLQLLLARCLEAAAELDPSSGAAHLPGLRVARPGEFSERAFLNGKMDLAQAEAVADLIDASTEAAARSAARSLGGAFSHQVQTLRQALIQLRTLIEATLDFPEEEIDVLTSTDARGQLSNLKQHAQSVLAQASKGMLLREGIKVVIAGQPNAGKSSLLNALAGAELAIVTAVPGTTRDRLAQTIQIQGVPVHVVDTAGLRASEDEVEKLGIERAWQAITQADAVLFLHDLSRVDAPDYCAADAQIALMLAEKMPAGAVLIDIWNKVDVAPQHAVGTGMALSAKTGQGLDALRLRLLQAAGWQGAGEGVFMARERQVQALRRAHGHLQAACNWAQNTGVQLDVLAEELRLAQLALGEITGEFTSEDLLGVIFSKFCIGK